VTERLRAATAALAVALVVAVGCARAPAPAGEAPDRVAASGAGDLPFVAAHHAALGRPPLRAGPGRGAWAKLIAIVFPSQTPAAAGAAARAGDDAPPPCPPFVALRAPRSPRGPPRT
jgi:hypothetical protein